MGTASTMACLTEALGIAPLGSACPPANGGQRLRVAELTGKLAAGPLLRPSEVLTRASFENAITVLQTIGGSTNAIVHLLAIAGRMPGVNLTLDDFDRIGRKTPLLVDLKPSGMNYMEDFYKVSRSIETALTDRLVEYRHSCSSFDPCCTWTHGL